MLYGAIFQIWAIYLDCLLIKYDRGKLLHASNVNSSPFILRPRPPPAPLLPPTTFYYKGAPTVFENVHNGN